MRGAAFVAVLAVIGPAGISARAAPTPVRVTAKVEAHDVGQPWGAVPGLLQFRGNPTHTWYGRGPVPTAPKVLWRFPKKEPMCSVSYVGRTPKRWCGTGWTGQPVVWDRQDGVTEVIFGAFDRRVHFLDAATGERTRPDFVARDIIKGTVTLDPDGFPLLYTGARDDRFRVIALDRKKPTVLWEIHSSDYPGLYDNDWDGNASIVDDMLLDGGENGYFFAVKLNRRYGPNRRVQVTPQIRLAVPGWTDALRTAVGDNVTSIESSVAVFEDRVYFSNGLGRVVGLSLPAAAAGRAEMVFDYWLGDDIDASIVIDQEGMLYVAVELERFLPRALEVGQLVKLNPYASGDPLVWGIPVGAGIGDERGGGIWSTPALGDGVLYATSESGFVMAVDRLTGKLEWSEWRRTHLWSSPVVVDGTLLVATCNGELLAYDIKNPRRPELRWSLTITRACIESTPAVWRGRIFVGTWDGHVYAVGDAPVATRP
jgi:hypothetical protein